MTETSEVQPPEEGGTPTLRSRLRGLVVNLVLLGAGLGVALLIGEFTSRIVFPISDGAANVSLDGSPITGWTRPGSAYRQISSEYDALTTITEQGYRVPEGGDDPEVVFLGDSFTFGWGVPDSSTFVHVFCGRVGLRCANLGVPSTGTAQQVDRLEGYLHERGWRPREVILMIFAMTGNFSAGNDLKDNYDYVRWSGHEPGRRWVPGPRQPGTPNWDEEGEPGVIERALDWRESLQTRSNLIRIVKYYFGPALKTLIRPGIDEARLDEALALTGAELERLDLVAKQYGFDYSIYLIHPLQDIARGTDSETTRLLNEISPAPVTSSAEAFRDGVDQYYFPYDGHLNEAGARALGAYLGRLRGASE